MSSLRVKLTAAMLLVVCLALVLVVLGVDSALQRDYLRAQEISLLAQANIVANAIKSDLMYHPQRVGMTVKDFSQEINGRIVVTDNLGVAIADVFDDPEIINREINIKEVQAALQGEQEAGNRLLKDGVATMYAAVPVMFGDRLLGAVLISQSLEEIYDLINNNRWRLGGAVLVTGLAGALASFGMASVLTSRIATLMQAARDIGGGNLDIEVSISGQDEIAQLGHTFNQMAARLRYAEEMRKQFFADAAHELRTPVSAIKALCEPLAFGGPLDLATYREFSQDIHSQAQRLSTLVDDFLRVSSLDRTLTIDKERTDLGALVQEAAKQMRPLAQQKEITLKILPRQLFGEVDYDKITQVLINIMHNAIKYTPAGGRVQVKMETGYRGIAIEVADNGIGIPPDAQEHIFERFYRVEKSRAREQGGTGLGLAIAKQIVELHGGFIEVHSEEGQGTAIVVWLPEN